MDVGLERAVHEPNRAARASVAVAVAGLALPPVAIAASQMLGRFDLLEAVYASPAAALLGAVAILLARRARRRSERTLGRIGELRLARAGRILGIVAVCVGITAALSLGFYGLLRALG